MYYYNDYLCVSLTSKTNIMTTFTNTTGTKAVNVSKDATGTFRAMFVQIYNNDQQVLDSKDFSTLVRAEKWANKVLN